MTRWRTHSHLLIKLPLLSNLLRLGHRRQLAVFDGQVKLGEVVLENLDAAGGGQGAFGAGRGGEGARAGGGGQEGLRNTKS